MSLLVLWFALPTCRSEQLPQKVKPMSDDAPIPSPAAVHGQAAPAAGRFVLTTMREEKERFVLLTRRTNLSFFIDKEQQDAERLIKVAREALDFNIAVDFVAAGVEGSRLTSLTPVWPANFKKPGCPTAPEHASTDFWKSQEAGREQQDAVRWVTKRADCGLHEVHFHGGHGVYYVHENAPRALEMVASAWRSVNEAQKVVYACGKHMPTWIFKLALAPEP